MATQITTRFIADSAVTAGKIDLTGSFDFSSGTVSVAAPTVGTHAATKTYVDNAINGLHWKESVKVATTGNITLSNTITIDGVAVSAGERVLVRAQTSAYENGIYICAAGSWSRASDMNGASEFSGSAVFVQQGSTYADVAFVCTNNGDVSVGTDSITFVQFTGAGAFSAGDGLTLTGTEFSINLDGSSLAVSGSGIKIADGGIASSMIPDGLIANVKLANSTISGVSLGSNLNSLSAGNGLSMTSYNGSAAVSDLTINLDGSSLAVGVNGIKIADNGVTSAKINDQAVDNSKLANNSVTTGKLDFAGFYSEFTASAAQTTFDLGAALDLEFKELFVVTVNGLAMRYAASPSAADQYSIANDGSNSVGRITFGSGLESGDLVSIRGFINN